jgi:integrase
MRVIMRDGSGSMRLRYITEHVDRHGNVRVYVRRRGRWIRLRETPGTTEFLDEYRRAVGGEAPLAPQAKHRPRPARESLRWLTELYYGSAEFKSLVRGHVRRRLLETICEEHGDKPYRLMLPRHVRTLRDERADAPATANARVKALRQVFAWAIAVGHADSNPAREVPYIRTASDGFHTWTVDEVKRYQQRHAMGTKARLALELMLLTGVRRSDAVRLGRQHERDGWLNFTEAKGRTRKVKAREIPILPQLRSCLDATPSGHLTYLVTMFGKPFTSNGFGNWFRRRCNEAGLPHCSAHGLRKAGATIAAENGATEHQLMAIYGWESTKQAAIYTRAANRKRLVGSAMHLIAPEQKPDESVALRSAVAPGATKSPAK